MDIKHVFALALFVLSPLHAFAARYSSPGEALFIGALQGLLIAVVIWIYNALKNRNKTNDDDK